MNLVVRVLRWLGVKAVMIVAIAVALSVAAFCVNWVKANRLSLAQAHALRHEISVLRTTLGNTEALAVAKQKTLEELQQREPDWLWSFLQHAKWAMEYRAVEAAYDAAQARAEHLKARLRNKELALRTAEAKISAAYAGVVETFYQTRRQILWVIALVLVGPTAWKLAWYYGFASLASRARPLRLLPQDDGSCAVGASAKMCRVPLLPDQRLIARMEWVQQYPPSARKRTKFLWKWKAPLVSCVAGLTEMTEWCAARTEAGGELLLASGTDPEKFVLRVDMVNHPGIALNPACVVAVTDSIDVTTRWRLGSLHSWISGRLRTILFRGTGAIFVCGYGGVRSFVPGADYRIEEALVLGFDGALDFAVARTETFWPYYRNKTSLFDYRFSGNRQVIAQQALPEAKRASGNPFVRTVNAVLNGIGNLLGF
jgi:uncharacterized protein (AIM24 family)